MNTANLLVIYDNKLWIQEEIDFSAGKRLLRAANDLNFTIGVNIGDMPDRIATSSDVWQKLILDHKLVEIKDQRCHSRTIVVDNGWWYEECYEQDGHLMFSSCGNNNYKDGIRFSNHLTYKNKNKPMSVSLSVKSYSSNESAEFQKHFKAVQFCLENKLSFPKETSEFFSLYPLFSFFQIT